MPLFMPIYKAIPVDVLRYNSHFLSKFHDLTLPKVMPDILLQLLTSCFNYRGPYSGTELPVIFQILLAFLYTWLAITLFFICSAK